MLAVHDVNVTSTAHVMTTDRGSKAASEVLSPAQTDLRLHGFRLSGPQESPGHYGSRRGLTGRQRAPQGVGGAPLSTPTPTDWGRETPTPANWAVCIKVCVSHPLAGVSDRPTPTGTEGEGNFPAYGFRGFAGGAS